MKYGVPISFPFKPKAKSHLRWQYVNRLRRGPLRRFDRKTMMVVFRGAIWEANGNGFPIISPWKDDKRLEAKLGIALRSLVPKSTAGWALKSAFHQQMSPTREGNLVFNEHISAAIGKFAKCCWLSWAKYNAKNEHQPIVVCQLSQIISPYCSRLMSGIWNPNVIIIFLNLNVTL